MALIQQQLAELQGADPQRTLWILLDFKKALSFYLRKGK